MEGYPGGWPTAGHPADITGARAPGLSQVDLERLRKPLEMTDVDALRASPAGPSAQWLMDMAEDCERGLVFVDGFQ